MFLSSYYSFFFFNDPATTEIYTLSLHDALPISARRRAGSDRPPTPSIPACSSNRHDGERSEEHTSELQSRRDLVCRLLLEKKKSRQRRNCAEKPLAADDLRRLVPPHAS